MRKLFLRNVRKLSGLCSTDASLDDAADANLYEPDALPSRPHQSLRPRSRLPPVDMARRLFAAQYMYIGTIFAFTDPGDSFERLLAGAYHHRGGAPDPRDRDGCLARAKVLLVLAFGQLYSVNQWVGSRRPPGFDYFTDALNLLPESHEAGSILCVETLALAGYFMQNMNRRDAAFQYVGRALRMAISLGLHQEVSPGAATAGAGAGAGTGETAAGGDDASAREHRGGACGGPSTASTASCASSRATPSPFKTTTSASTSPRRCPAKTTRATARPWCCAITRSCRASSARST